MGTIANGSLTLSASKSVENYDTFISCNGGQRLGFAYLVRSMRFYYGAKSVTLGPGKSARFAGYRIAVGVANSKRLTFTLDVL